MPDLKEIQQELFIKDVTNKLARYCAYQERSSGEVLKKIAKYKLEENTERGIFENLKADGFFNDKRYAEAYVNGKLRSNQWGWLKIKNGLIEKGIDKQTVEEVYDIIDLKEYDSVIKKLIQRKALTTKDENSFIRKNKIARYLLAKGFEGDKVWQAIDDFES